MLDAIINNKNKKLTTFLTDTLNTSSGQISTRETTISKEVNLWKIRELAISDGGLLNGTFYIICYICIYVIV